MWSLFGPIAKLWKRLLSSPCLSVCLSICMEQLSSHWTNFYEIWNLKIFWKSVKKTHFLLKSDQIMGTSLKCLYTLMIISRSVLLGMRNVWDKSYREKQNTHSMLHHVLYDTMWKNMVLPDRSQMTIWRMHFAGWMPKATDTHSEYVTLQAFSRQLWLCKRASMSCYMYIACLVH